MNMDHVQPFLDAMHSGDKNGLVAHLAEDVSLSSPIIVEPFKGKSKVASVLGAILDIADKFEATNILTSDQNAAVILAIQAGKTKVEGVDYMHINEAGLIDSMIIQWRPLPEVVAIQQLLAPVIGMPALKLVEA